ncbi:MAG: alpha/beta fold hydrolase [Candidatus Limnocylindrales bacterium]
MSPPHSEPDAGPLAGCRTRPGLSGIETVEASAFSASNDLGVSYDSSGPLGAPVIVLIHGMRLSRSMWAAQIADLRDDYRVIALDLPGHGVLADSPFSLDAAADQVALVIQSVVGERTGGRAVVVGLSLGGYVAMNLAARRPDLVRGLVVSGATAEPVSWRSLPFRALAAVIQRFEGARLVALNAWFFRSRYPPAIAEPIVAGGFWTVGGTAALRSLIGERFIPRLAAYPGPILLINGALDLPFRLYAPSFARAGRDVRRVRLAGATHLANLDRPRAFSAAVRSFMRELDQAA